MTELSIHSTVQNRTYPKTLPSADYLNSVFRYDQDSGKLYWRQRHADSFDHDKHARSVEWRARNWNSIYASKEAFTTILKSGYKSGTLNTRKFYAHRIIWKMVHGEDPKWVDHINGDRSDNRISNLRSVEVSENGKNMALQTRNISGKHGVTWDRAREKWFVRITHHRKVIRLGRYDSLDEAISVRKKAEETYGFHKNHGRYTV